MNKTAPSDWYNQGEVVYYDPERKRIYNSEKENTIRVFDRVLTPGSEDLLPPASTCWCTFLAGFQESSYSFAEVEQALTEIVTPRLLYVDYIGQGFSKCPTEHSTTIIEHADLVEAQWKAHGIKNTVIVAHDFSALVVTELLQRQRSRSRRGIPLPRIDHVLIVDGVYRPKEQDVADLTREGAKSRRLVKPLSPEKRKLQKAKFCCSHLLEEHRRNSARWDIKALFMNYCSQQEITFHLVRTSGQFADQFDRARKDLARLRPDVYLEDLSTVSDNSLPEQLARRVDAMLRKAANAKPTYASSESMSVLPAPCFSSVRSCPEILLHEIGAAPRWEDLIAEPATPANPATPATGQA